MELELCGIELCGMARHGMAWFGMAQCMEWVDMALHGIILFEGEWVV